MERGQRVIIVGAGYAGRAAASRVALREPSVQVTIVAPEEVALERARLHQQIAGADAMRWRLDDVLPRGVRRVAGVVERVELAARRVWVAGQAAPLEYDWLVVCAGSRTAARVAGAVVLEDARLPGLVREEVARGGSVEVLGAGLSGVEVACELAERYARRASVALVARDGVLPGASEAARAHTERVLAARGVSIRREASGARLQIAATGFEAAQVAGLEGCARSADGRLLVGPGLELVGWPGVWVAGDMAAVEDGEGGYVRQSCAAAMPMGSFAGESVAARMAGRDAGIFSVRLEAVCVGLGRRDGVIDQAQGRWALRGRSAAWIKEGILKATMGAMWAERASGLAVYNWLKRGEVRGLLEA